MTMATRSSTQQKRLESLVLSGQASEQDYETLGREEVLRLKSDPEVAQLRDFVPEQYEIKALGKRTFRFVFSSEKPDRGGDILKASGWVLDDMEKNPVVLWSHDGRSHPPVGRVNAFQRRIVVDGFKGLGGDVEFAPEGVSPLIDTLHALTESGFLRATSVGAMILDTKNIDDEEERSKLGLGRFGIFATKMRLKEVSLVSIGMHQDALKRECDTLLGRNLVSKEGVAEFLNSAIPTKRDYARAIKELCSESFHIDIDWDALEPEEPAVAKEEEPKDVTGTFMVDMDTTASTTSNNGVIHPTRYYTVNPDGTLKEMPAQPPQVIPFQLDLASVLGADKLAAAVLSQVSKDEEVEALKEQIRSLTRGNERLAEAVQALADALADQTERNLMADSSDHQMADGPVEDDPDAELESFRTELSSMAASAAERVRGAIQPKPKT